MARYEHLPIYKAALDVAVYLENTVKTFSRYHKYTIGQELRNLTRDIVKPCFFFVGRDSHPDVFGRYGGKRPNWKQNPVSGRETRKDRMVKRLDRRSGFISRQNG